MKNSIYSFFLIFTILIVAGTFQSCSDDDKDGGQPVIESVRVTDPSLVDSTFVQAEPGKMIVIQGRNLAHASALYINDQNVSFNPNMNTDHSLIATIPTETDGFQLTVWNSELSPEIRLVTPGGVATFAFKVLAPVPAISRISGRYPRVAGDKLTVYGTNFLDVTRVYFSDVNPAAVDPETGEKPGKGDEVDVTSYELSQNRYLDEKTKKYVSDSEMRLTLPQLSYDNGFIVIETPQGRSVMEYASLPPAPVLTSISSDMPVPGSRVTMKGSYFIDVTGIKIGDDIKVAAADITVEDNESELSFIMPEKPTETTTISVVTPGGESNAFHFYRYETLLVDFDGRGKDLKWDPNAQYKIATPDAEPYVSDGYFGLFDCENPAWNWWGTMIFFESSEGNSYTLPSFDIIPADTPVEDVYFVFECYNKYTFLKYFQYQLSGRDGVTYLWMNKNPDTGMQIVPEFQDPFGEQYFGKWYSTVVPMSRFDNFAGKTYKDIVDAGIYRIRLMLQNHSGEAEQVFLCVDNIRISTIQKFTPEI